MQGRMLRATIVVLGVVFLFTSTGCPHHLSGRAERMRRPKGAKKRPKDKPDPTKGMFKLKADKECSVNFNKNTKHTPNQRASNKFLSQGNDLIKTAMKQKGEEQIETYIDALSKLRNALKKDNYSAQATYRLAAVYARLAKQGCALLLLKRLMALQSHPNAKIVRSADLAIKNAVDDGAFKAFRNAANSAMGQ